MYFTNCKVWRRLCCGVCVWGGAFANCKVGDLHQVKCKLNKTDYHNILQYHVIPSGMRLVAQGFLLIQDND